MSLYGRVKRVDSSPFQFDRHYQNRKAMEDNQANDGVFVGRYILIEYGERYQKESENSNNLIEREEYRANKLIDMETYGDVYDSTVWIKIYSGETEKYVMIAELNAIAPQLELINEGALEYTETQSANDTVDIFRNNEIETLIGFQENAKTPYFDISRNNELFYDLHMPGPLKLNVSKNNLNFGQKLNNIVYGAEDKAIEEQKSYATWTTDVNNIEDGTEAESKTLRINFEALGYAIKDIYDLLYGIPNGENQVRPFFEDDWVKANTNPSPHYKNDGKNYTGQNLNAENDSLDWVKNLGRMIKGNSSKGLAGIIQDLFASRNPLTGVVVYYLLNSWNMNYANNESESIPTISNKPEIITQADYYTITSGGNTTRQFLAPKDTPLCHYGIDYNTWSIIGVEGVAVETSSNEENN